MLPTDDLAPADRRPAVIDTPLGIVGFDVTLGSEALPATPNAVWRLANGSHLHRWQQRGATVDLLLGGIDVPPWDGGAPVPMWAAIWQVRATETVPALTISAEVTDLPADAYGSPDPAECLAAITIENDHFMVSFGGPDTELLAMQAADGRLMPTTWTQHLPTDDTTPDYGVHYPTPHRITWQLPALAPQEAARLCIPTAWSPRDDDRPAAWYAIDLPLDTAYHHLTTGQVDC
ncbi:hypothetical protein [Nocardia sp. NPDC050406]|uniref:hypothetical protein n=1 Tax=Nocardia sp. NPDC050406 TaxID=3364318 RepID=UPI0037BB35A1